MKKILLQITLLFLLSNVFYAQSGWFWQNPLPQGNNLYDVELVGNGIAYACGEAGTIIKTTDNGNSWIILRTDSGYTNSSLDFLNINTGWVIGKNVMKTTDGGISWINKMLIGNNPSYSIEMVTLDTGYFTISNNYGGFIFETTDSGENWNSVYYQEGKYVYSTFFINALTGYACGTLGIIKTTNGGLNWVNQYSVQFSKLHSIKFINANTGYAVGANYMDYIIVLRTTNGGVNWNSFGGLGMGYLNSVHFINDFTGYSCGFIEFVKTTNSGLVWSNVILSDSGINLRAIDFSSQYGIMVGDLGLILNTTNSGLDWINYFNSYRGYQFGSPEIECIRFANKYTGYALNGYVILKTSNEGNTWEPITPPGTTNVSEFLTVFDSTIFIAGGQHILKSTNSGNNWITQSHNLTGIKYINFINRDTGFCCGSNGYARTLNGGLNWINGSLNLSLYTIYFVNIMTGFAKGISVSYKTIDGGITWTTLQTAESVGYSICFVNNNTGYTITNSQIRKTTNGGINWVSQLNGTWMLDLNFQNELTGFAVGNQGTIIKTTDGGLNWIYQKSGTNNQLRTVYSMDSNICYAGGFGKIILKTSTGGNVIGINSITENIPENFSLSQNYPNPFNPVTKIRFQIAGLSDVTLTIYDMLGREVTTLVNEELKPGTYEANWDASNFSSGVYFYKIISGDYTETKKMVLMK